MCYRNNPSTKISHFVDAVGLIRFFFEYYWICRMELQENLLFSSIFGISTYITMHLEIGYKLLNVFYYVSDRANRSKNQTYKLYVNRWYVFIMNIMVTSDVFSKRKQETTTNLVLLLGPILSFTSSSRSSSDFTSSSESENSPSFSILPIGN